MVSTERERAYLDDLDRDRRPTVNMGRALRRSAVAGMLAVGSACGVAVYFLDRALGPNPLANLFEIRATCDEWFFQSRFSPVGFEQVPPILPSHGSWKAGEEEQTMHVLVHISSPNNPVLRPGEYITLGPTSIPIK